MDARDKNYSIIHLGHYVEVPEPNKNFDDAWNNSFIGSVLAIDEDNILTIEDSEGDCFAVECERVSII